MEKLEFNIDSSEKNVRIDKYLAECCPDFRVLICRSC